jgi:hypothetical protein
VTSLVKGLSGMPLERVSASGVRAFPRRHIMTWALFMLASMSISYSIYGMDYFLLFLLVAYSALLALMVGGNYRNGVMARRVRDTLIGLERIGYEFWLDRDVGLVDFRDARGELLGRDMTAVGWIWKGWRFWCGGAAVYGEVFTGGCRVLERWSGGV